MLFPRSALRSPKLFIQPYPPPFAPLNSLPGRKQAPKASRIKMGYIVLSINFGHQITTKWWLSRQDTDSAECSLEWSQFVDQASKEKVTVLKDVEVALGFEPFCCSFCFHFALWEVVLTVTRGTRWRYRRNSLANCFGLRQFSISAKVL